MNAELRPGNVYTFKNAKDFYEKLESNGVTYAIRMKENDPLINASADYFTELCNLTKDNQIDYSVVYGEFYYKADCWLYPRRVVVKVEKP